MQGSPRKLQMSLMGMLAVGGHSRSQHALDPLYSAPLLECHGSAPVLLVGRDSFLLGVQCFWAPQSLGLTLSLERPCLLDME